MSDMDNKQPLNKSQKNFWGNVTPMTPKIANQLYQCKRKWNYEFNCWETQCGNSTQKEGTSYCEFCNKQIFEC